MTALGPAQHRLGVPMDRLFHAKVVSVFAAHVVVGDWQSVGGSLKNLRAEFDRLARSGRRSNRQTLLQ